MAAVEPLDGGPRDLRDVPAHLSALSAQMWREVTAAWDLGVGDLIVLQAALEHWDRAHRLAALVARRGLNSEAGRRLSRLEQAAWAGFYRGMTALKLRDRAPVGVPVGGGIPGGRRVGRPPDRRPPRSQLSALLD